MADAGVIPEPFIQELLSRVDIVDVVERSITLKKTGANYSACCPFHSEKTPSFTVSPSKQFYHCFGCGAHGSAIGFVMQYAGLGFVEAVEELAQNVGMTVPVSSDNRQAERTKKAPLTKLMASAGRFYKGQLKTSQKAIDYLKGRGLTGEIAAQFGLGYAPDGWQSLQKVFEEYNDTALVECGLVIVNDQGRRYDRFRDRIMFPILDTRGNVIGFGSRFIGDHKAAQLENEGVGPKYLNSPETPLFEKGRELYGLTQARQAIRDADQVIVVEGYMDVVALAQHGIGNAVATLGTACTSTHVHKLLRQATKVIFCFDGDAAGRKAAWRALDASLDQLTDDRTVSFMFLPSEHDPDSFVRAEGAEVFRDLAAHATTLTDFLLSELKTEVDLSSAEGRAQLVYAAKPLILKLAAPILRVQLIKMVADAARMTSVEVESQCGLTSAAGRGQSPTSAKRKAAKTGIQAAAVGGDNVRPEPGKQQLYTNLANLCALDFDAVERVPLEFIDHFAETIIRWFGLAQGDSSETGVERLSNLSDSALRSYIHLGLQREQEVRPVGSNAVKAEVDALIDAFERVRVREKKRGDFDTLLGGGQ